MLTCSSDYINAIYADARQINGRITFTVNGSSNVYDDNRITQMTILEELSTLNDSIPSDEIQVTLDNTDGTFNFLNLSNMHQIIAQRPSIKAELGLIVNKVTDTKTTNLNGKITNSTIVNGNKYKYLDNAGLPTNITAWTTECSQSHQTAVYSVDGSTSSLTTSVSGKSRYALFQFDIIRALTDAYGDVIWQGKTLLSDKVALAQTIIGSKTTNWYGYGTNPTGNTVYLKWWNGSTSTWSSGTTGTGTTIANRPLTSATDAYICPDGCLYLVVYTDASDGTTASTLYTDYVELVLTLANFTALEWQPLGTYYLDSWKNDVGAVTVTLIGHDNFTMLDNIAYGGPNTGQNMTLYNIAVDVFNKANITNYSIDSSLSNYTTTTGFKESMTCRVALQHIGIAAKCAVYQDRNGVMQIKPFISIDSASSYITYPTTQNGQIWAGLNPLDSGAYAELNDGNGMKRLDLNNMWTVPEIALDKSIYQLIIKVYSDINTSTDYTIINSNIAGQNGQSFTIDNPLINNNTLAQAVADWFINESNFNVVYKSNWRGNPILEGADIVTISNGIDLTYAKSARIYKQEWQYQGYLTCQTEARGGV